MADLIGSCIENTKDISDTVKITLKINDSMNKITNLLNQEQLLHENKPSNEIEAEMKEYITKICDMFEELQLNRKAAEILEYNLGSSSSKD